MNIKQIHCSVIYLAPLLTIAVIASQCFRSHPNEIYLPQVALEVPCNTIKLPPPLAATTTSEEDDGEVANLAKGVHTYYIQIDTSKAEHTILCSIEVMPLLFLLLLTYIFSKSCSPIKSNKCVHIFHVEKYLLLNNFVAKC